MQAGFDPTNLLIFRLDPVRNGYSPVQARTLYARALEELAALPGVRSATLLNIPLIGAGGARGLAALPDAPTLELGTPAARAFFLAHEAHMLTVGDDFFSTLGIPLRRGRTLSSSDVAEAQPVAIVNEALARQLFGSEDAIGRVVQDRPQSQGNDLRGGRRLRGYEVHVAAPAVAADRLLHAIASASSTRQRLP